MQKYKKGEKERERKRKRNYMKNENKRESKRKKKRSEPAVQERDILGDKKRMGVRKRDLCEIK